MQVMIFKSDILKCPAFVEDRSMLSYANQYLKEEGLLLWSVDALIKSIILHNPFQ